MDDHAAAEDTTATPPPPTQAEIGAGMDAILAQLGAAVPGMIASGVDSEAEKLKNLSDHIERTVEDEFTEQEAAQESTKRAALQVITLSLTAIGLSMLGLLAFASVRGDAALIQTIADATQPSTLMIAVVSSLGGLAAGAGLAGKS